MNAALTIDLTVPAAQQWKLPPDLAEQARLLTQSYIADLGGAALFDGMLETYAEACVPRSYHAEMQALAQATGQSMADVLLGNLYYDAVKLVLGCTAFAVDTPNGPLHARNLDWWTENNMLSAYTLVTDYINDPPGHRFSTVGWPGFIGALSGVAPGRFAITLNAVLSDEPSAFAESIAFLIRFVLEQATSFSEAVEILSTRPIATDCLLLVSGTQLGEMVVIERTPTQSALRTSDQGYLVVANDYLLIDADTATVTGDLQRTSCHRYDRALACMQHKKPQTIEACFDVLRDPAIQMGITVQHMVFSARTGQCTVRLP